MHRLTAKDIKSGDQFEVSAIVPRQIKMLYNVLTVQYVISERGGLILFSNGMWWTFKEFRSRIEHSLNKYSSIHFKVTRKGTTLWDSYEISKQRCKT